MKKIYNLLILTLLFSDIFGQATIPISTTTLSVSALPTGFSHIGLGTNYTTPTNPALRFDSQGDYLQVDYSSQAIYVNFTLKGNPASGAWSGTFSLLESDDNITYTTITNITSISAATSGQYFVAIPKSTTRYLRWFFTTKTNGNVALCKINILNSIPLPVELQKFRGFDNSLQWQTASEKNNNGFEIYGSKDGREFEMLGFETGNGTTSTTMFYLFNLTDCNLKYYKLRQVDNDGHFEWSDIIMHEFECKNNNKSYIDLQGKLVDSTNATGVYIDKSTGLKFHKIK